MHYKIKDYIVESELAAKSVFQPNKNVLNYINHIPPSYKVLDYGCGKLRYTLPLSNRVKKVVAIDSTEQIRKLQIINGQRIKLSDVKLDNVTIFALEDQEWKDESYDLVFCTNVLSAIPFECIREELISNAYTVLNDKGQLYITVQYRNSYFSQYNKRQDVEKFEDGWLILKNNHRGMFYAPLTSEYIVMLCKKNGFRKFKVSNKDGSCYIIATK